MYSLQNNTAQHIRNLLLLGGNPERIAKRYGWRKVRIVMKQMGLPEEQGDI